MDFSRLAEREPDIRVLDKPLRIKTSVVENLSLHIEYLLLRNECVVVPGFGAFLNVWHPARYDEEEGLFYPMQREVRFNSALGHDDGLLASSFTRKYGVSFQEGRELLRHEISSLREALADDGEATVGRLGILRRDHEGRISFAPFKSGAGMMQEIGFIPVRKEAHFKSVADVPEEIAAERREMKMEPAKATAMTPAAEATASIDVETQTASEEKPRRRFDTDRNYYIPVNKIFARTAACLLLVMAVAVSVILPASHRMRQDKASVVPVEEILHKAATTVKEKVVETPKTATPAEATVETAPARYHLIVGTFRTMQEAETFVEANRGCGYELRIEESKTYMRVSAARGSDRAEVAETLGDPVFKQQFAQAWVWESPQAK